MSESVATSGSFAKSRRGSSLVLVVDDEKTILGALVKSLKKEGCQVEGVESAEAAFEKLQEQTYGVVLLDLSLPRMGGLEALRLIKDRHPNTEVVVITGQGTVDIAVECMKLGAFDLLTKPFENIRLVGLTVRRAQERRFLLARNLELLEQLESREEVDSIVAVSSQMRALLDAARTVAVRDSPVLISGESGTGKELIARSVHKRSERRGHEFVAVNCGALPHSVIESELFGHVKGAFTGAVSDTVGLFRKADGGTIFLDEIGELPQALQVKLLRALEEGEIRPVGATVSVHVDVRVIAATNRNLENEVVEGNFRNDLYYRLAVVPLHIPPLRDRPEDVTALVYRFMQRFNGDQPKFEGVETEAMDLMVQYAWPGNVRELRNVIERAFALGQGKLLKIDDLPRSVRLGTVRSASGSSVVRFDKELPLTLEAYERLALERALSQSDGDPTRAARLLGVSRATFYRKMNKAGVKRLKSALESRP